MEEGEGRGREGEENRWRKWDRDKRFSVFNEHYVSGSHICMCCMYVLYVCMYVLYVCMCCMYVCMYVFARVAELGLHSVIDQAQSRRDQKQVANPSIGLRQAPPSGYYKSCMCV